MTKSTNITVYFDFSLKVLRPRITLFYSHTYSYLHFSCNNWTITIYQRWQEAKFYSFMTWEMLVAWRLSWIFASLCEDQKIHPILRTKVLRNDTSRKKMVQFRLVLFLKREICEILVSYLNYPKIIYPPTRRNLSWFLIVGSERLL